MRTPPAWTLVSLLATGLLIGIEARQTQSGGGTRRQVASVGDSAFVGSDACRACHRPAYEQWQRSVHVRMTQPSSSAFVLGDFSGAAVMPGPAGRYAVAQREGRRRVVISAGGRPTETHDVEYTLGEKRLQGYMSRLPDGRVYVLPLFWHRDWQRWLDWRALTPVDDRTTATAGTRTGDTLAADDHRQIWNINCFNCHATNIQRNFDVARRRFDTTWTEMGVGCEACHGPGRAHVERLTAWGKDASAYPDIEPGAPGIDLSGPLAIFVPRTATPRQVYDSCAYCHGNKTNSFVGFAPGDRLEDFAQFALVSDPVPAHDRQGDYWPDGRPSRFNRPQALTMSGCFARGQATCATCHAAHGSPNEHSLKVPLAQADSLCTQCHDTVDRASHSHHASTSAGSSCIACHMSDVNWRLLTRRRDHTFQPPVPELTGRYGIPNSCTTCHDDRTPEWAAATMNSWYDNAPARGRAVAATDAVVAAAAADETSLPALRAQVVDRSRGALMRASAAGFIGRLLAGPLGPSDARGGNPSARQAAINALVAAASDPEPMVRIAAVRALANASGDLTISALAARLTDEARVVRASAAEALLLIGVVDLPGPRGAALRRAQDEYADSLRTFPDVAARHTALGWLLASQGRADQAKEEWRLATSLDPGDPRPHVYRGVLAARDGRYDAAIGEWETARRLDPRYPNLDRLIAKARASRH